MGIPLPDLRDGLSLPARKILSHLRRSRATSNGRFLKTVKLLTAISDDASLATLPELYAVLLRMVREWVCRYPLVINQGHVGAIDGDPPACMRFNEMYLSPLGESFSGQHDPHASLPGPFPNLLCNGAWAHSGTVETERYSESEPDEAGVYSPVDYVPLDDWIGGSLLSSIPPHNLGEIARALIHRVDHPRATIAEILQIVPGPDFPTGGTVLNEDSLLNLYRTGAGSLRIRSAATTEPGLRGKKLIAIKEIPYGANKTHLIERIAERVQSGEYGWISDIRDLSSREGMRIEIEIRRGYDEQRLLQSLTACDPLEQVVEFKMVAGKGDAGRRVSFLNLLDEFLDYRRHALGLRRGSTGDGALKQELERWIGISDARRTRIAQP